MIGPKKPVRAVSTVTVQQATEGSRHSQPVSGGLAPTDPSFSKRQKRSRFRLFRAVRDGRHVTR